MVLVVPVFVVGAGLLVTSAPTWADVPAVGPGVCVGPNCGKRTVRRSKYRRGGGRYAAAAAATRARARAELLRRRKLEEERYRKRRAITRLQLERAQRVIDQRAKDIRNLFGSRHAELLGRLHTSAYSSWDTPSVYLAGKTRARPLRGAAPKPYPKGHICHRYATVPKPTIRAGGPAQSTESRKRTVYDYATKLGPDAVDVLSSVFLTSNPVGMTVKATIEVSKSVNVATDAARKVAGRSEEALLGKIKNKGGRLVLGFKQKLQRLQQDKDQKRITPEKHRELVDLEKKRFNRNYRALVGAGRTGRLRQSDFWGVLRGAVFNAEVGMAVVDDLKERYSPMNLIAKHTIGKVGGKVTGALVKKAKRYTTVVVKKLAKDSPLSRIRWWRKVTGMVTETPISKVVGRGEDWVKNLATPSDLRPRPRPRLRPSAPATPAKPAVDLFPRCGHTRRR